MRDCGHQSIGTCRVAGCYQEAESGRVSPEKPTVASTVQLSFEEKLSTGKRYVVRVKVRGSGRAYGELGLINSMYLWINKGTGVRSWVTSPVEAMLYERQCDAKNAVQWAKRWCREQAVTNIMSWAIVPVTVTIKAAEDAVWSDG